MLDKPPSPTTQTPQPQRSQERDLDLEFWLIQHNIMRYDTIYNTKQIQYNKIPIPRTTPETKRSLGTCWLSPRKIKGGYSSLSFLIFFLFLTDSRRRSRQVSNKNARRGGALDLLFSCQKYLNTARFSHSISGLCMQRSGSGLDLPGDMRQGLQCRIG